jgi:hypothetical protein
MEEELRAELDLMQADIATLSGAFSALRLLLETQFADRFASDPAQFASVMDKLIELTRTATTTAEPMTDEARIEGMAQVAAQLQRFAHSTAQRIASRQR